MSPDTMGITIIYFNQPMIFINISYKVWEERMIPNDCVLTNGDINISMYGSIIEPGIPQK